MRQLFEWIKYSDFYKSHIKNLKFTMFLRKIRDIFVLAKRRWQDWMKEKEKKENILSLLETNLYQEQSITNTKTDETVDVIVPIYNGYEYLLDLFSDLLCTNVDCRYILVDDKSPDERVRKLEREFVAAQKNAILLENKENAGFVKTANRGLKEAKGHAVLVNTDTRLPKKWLERLLAPILEDEKVASATPYSNSATIFSFPKFGSNNAIYLGLDTNTLDRYFQKIRPRYVDAPTGVGFCMAMSKKALKEIGLLDEETFGRGYGEENDWCQRAKKKGYKNVQVENLFVYHRHGGSFVSEEKQKLIEEHAVKLSKKHRTYNYQVQRFVAKDPNKTLRQLLQMMIDSKEKRSVIYFDHSWGGGATGYMNIQIKKRLAEGACVFSVRYVYFDKWYEFRYHTPDGQMWTYTFRTIEDILTLGEVFHFDEIYLNELVTYPNLWEVQKILLQLKEQQGGKLIMLFHDYFAICPTINLMDSGRVFCQDKQGAECEACYQRNKFSNVYDCETRGEWVAHWHDFLSACDEVRCFSKDTLVRAKHNLGENLAYTLVPHEVSYVCPIPKKQKTTKTLNIGLLGVLAVHKGGEVVRALVQEIEKQGLDIKICLIGDLDGMHLEEGEHFSKTGRYVAQQLPTLIYENDIDLFFVASVWPETFSYTTEEIMKMDFPVVTFDWGAPAERVACYDKGLVLSHDLQADEILNRIQSFAKEQQGVLLPTVSHKRVLYVAEYLSFSSRYRLEHFREEMLFMGWQGDFYSLDNLPKNLNWDAYESLVVYRSRYQGKMKTLIDEAKLKGIQVLYDIDDLIFDIQQMDYKPSFDENVYGEFTEYSHKIKACMEQADKILVSTRTLAEAVKKTFGLKKQVFVNRNVASMEMAGYSALAREYKSRKREAFTLGYFSGSNTHNEDFEEIAEVLCDFMKAHQDVLLKIVGCMELPACFDAFKERILRVEFIPWQTLPEEIASVDVNLMPLCNSFFHHCKSENKWMEAALVEVVTIASDYQELRDVTVSDENIVLCQSEKDWKQGLERLYAEEEYRKQLAANAYRYVMDNKTTFTPKEELRRFMEER